MYIYKRNLKDSTWLNYKFDHLKDSTWLNYKIDNLNDSTWLNYKIDNLKDSTWLNYKFDNFKDSTWLNYKVDNLKDSTWLNYKFDNLKYSTWLNYKFDNLKDSTLLKDYLSNSYVKPTIMFCNTNLFIFNECVVCVKQEQVMFKSRTIHKTVSFQSAAYIMSMPRLFANPRYIVHAYPTVHTSRRVSSGTKRGP